MDDEDKTIRKKFAALIPKPIQKANKEIVKKEKAIEKSVEPVVEKIVSELKTRSGFDDRASIPSAEQQQKNLPNYKNPEFWSRGYETGTIAFATGGAIIAGPATAGAVTAYMATGLLRAIGVDLP